MTKSSVICRLKSKTAINSLFKEGKFFVSKNLIFRFLNSSSAGNKLFCGVSVRKTTFKKAVERNKIKRQLRVAFQKVNFFLPNSGFCMLIFKGPSALETKKVVDEFKTLLKSF